MIFAVTQGGMWFEGYWWWVPPGGDTGPQKFALYPVVETSGSSPVPGSLITGSVVTSGTLTAGAWNYVALASPVQLSIGATGASAGGLFVATTAWTAVNGFPDTNSQFGTGDPYASGITSGPLTTFGQSTNTAGLLAGSTFGTAGSDPETVAPPLNTDSTFDNFWLDVQVSDTAPSGYSGTYRLYPNRGDANAVTAPDSAVNYVIGTEIRLSQACTVNNIWYFSPAGTAQLATRASVYSVTGADSGSEVVAVTSPTWLAPGGSAFTAGTGWAYVSAGNVNLTAGTYKVAVYNGAVTPDSWSATDASSVYWGTGEGASGVTAGPLYAPQAASASTAYIYNSGNPGSAPPYDGSGTTSGQGTFAMTGPQYPYLYVNSEAQNYWLDLEVTPGGGAHSVTLAATVGVGAVLRRGMTRQVPAGAVSGVGVSRGVGFRVAATAGTGSVLQRGVGKFLNAMVSGVAAVVSATGELVSGVLVILLPGAGVKRVRGDWRVVLPSPAVGVEGFLGTVGQLTVRLPVPTVVLTGLQPSGLKIRLPAPVVSLAGRPEYGHLTVRLPAPVVGLTGKIGHAGAWQVLFGQTPLKLVRAFLGLPGGELPEWSVGSPGVYWKAGMAATEWTVGYNSASINHLSTEYVIVPVQATKAGAPYDPTSDVVQFAFAPTPNYSPQTSDWQTGSWDTASSSILYPYNAKCLVGPNGTVTLTQGTYVVYVKITDSPETPVIAAGQLSIT